VQRAPARAGLPSGARGERHLRPGRSGGGEQRGMLSRMPEQRAAGGGARGACLGPSCWPGEAAAPRVVHTSRKMNRASRAPKRRKEPEGRPAHVIAAHRPSQGGWLPPGWDCPRIEPVLILAGEPITACGPHPPGPGPAGSRAAPAPGRPGAAGCGKLPAPACARAAPAPRRLNRARCAARGGAPDHGGTPLGAGRGGGRSLCHLDARTRPCLTPARAGARRRPPCCGARRAAATAWAASSGLALARARAACRAWMPAAPFRAWRPSWRSRLRRRSSSSPRRSARPRLPARSLPAAMYCGFWEVSPAGAGQARRITMAAGRTAGRRWRLAENTLRGRQPHMFKNKCENMRGGARAF